MARLRPNSIRAMGLRSYLDATKQEHNGRGYDDFVSLVEDEFRANNRTLANGFNVSPETFYKWLNIYELEKRPQS